MMEYVPRHFISPPHNMVLRVIDNLRVALNDETLGQGIVEVANKTAFSNGTTQGQIGRLLAAIDVRT